MFIPNQIAKVRRANGFNVYGKKTFGQWENVPCGIVRLELVADATSVRADSSASRGSAMETKATSRLLFPAPVRLEHGDHVHLHGFDLVVESVWPRVSVTGELDHWQVDLMIRAE